MTGFQTPGGGSDRNVNTRGDRAEARRASTRVMTTRSQRSLGMFVAGAVALVIAGVVLLVIVNNKTKPRVGEDDIAIDIPSKPPKSGENSGEVVDLAAQSTGRFQAQDKNDPTRVAWELSYSKLDPTGMGVYTLGEPRAWVYFEDGQAAYIRADQGVVKKPASVDGQIESGTFSGNVVAMIFPKPPIVIEEAEPETKLTTEESAKSVKSGTGTFIRLPKVHAKVWDPDVDQPWLMAQSESISFDSILLEMSTDQPVRISTAEASFDAKSLLVRGNEVRSRIEYLKVGGPAMIRFHDRSVGREGEDVLAQETGVEAEGEGVTESAAAAEDEFFAQMPESEVVQPEMPEQAETRPGNEAVARGSEIHRGNEKDGKEDWYRAKFSGEVVALRQTQRLAGDELEIFARTLDNKLPEDAFGPKRKQEVIGRKTGIERQIVMKDRADAHEGKQTEEPGEVQQKVAEGSSLIESKDVQIDVADVDGAEDVVVETSVKPGADPNRTLFEKNVTDVVLTWNGVLEAMPTSKMPEELAGGNHVFGRFISGDGQPVRLRDERMGAVGHAGVIEYAVGKREVAMRSSPDVDRAWVYMPGSGFYVGRDVKVGLATGKVEMKAAGLLADAEFEEGSTPDLSIAALDSVKSADELPIAGERGSARRISWNDRADFAFLTRGGQMTSELREATFIGAVEARDRSSTLAGEQMRVEFAQEERNRGASLVHMFGPGKVEYVAAAKNEADGESGKIDRNHIDKFAATWQVEMKYDADEGQIECHGDAEAMATGLMASDVLKANRVLIDLEDAGEETVKTEHDGESSVLATSKRIAHVKAIGSSTEKENGKNASVQSRRYSPVDGGESQRKLDQVLYLEGAEIWADNVNGIVRVPTAGLAVFMDQRNAEAVSPMEGAGGMGGAGGAGEGEDTSISVRGTTKFDWTGSMMFTRETGVVELLDGVRMIHKPIDNQPFVMLTCAKLDAVVATESSVGEGGGAEDGRERSGRLMNATASGDVTIENGEGKRMVSQTAKYDAIRSIVEAGATGVNYVTFFDEKKAAPLQARRLRWDMIRDRVDIAEPMPMTAPR